MTIRLTDAETAFMACGICKVDPVHVYQPGIDQYACADSHFVCSKCDDGGRARCGCGQNLKLVTELDEDATRIAPYYAKRLRYACEECDFCTRHPATLSAHKTLSCRANQSRRISPDNSRVHARGGKTTTVVVSAGTLTASVCLTSGHQTIVRCDIGDVVFKQTSIAFVGTTYEACGMYAVVMCGASIVYGIFGGVPVEIRCLPEDVVVSVHSIFLQTPADPFESPRETHACAVSVTRWRSTLYNRLDGECIASLQDSREVAVLPTCYPPIGVISTQELCAFEDAANKIFHDRCQGGLLFYIPESPDKVINPFYLYIADGATDETVICPGCFMGFHFCMSGRSVCDHIQISEHYVRKMALRVNLPKFDLIQSDTMTPCMQRIHMTNFSHEVLPGYERRLDDVFPMHAKVSLSKTTNNYHATTQYFGKLFATGGRNRLAAVCVEATTGSQYRESGDVCEFEESVTYEVSCAVCNEVLCNLPKASRDVYKTIGAHFQLSIPIVVDFKMLMFDSTMSRYLFSNSTTLIKHPGVC